jgi:hypothetical protein
MTEPFEARQSKIVKKKINLLNNYSIRSARLFGPHRRVSTGFGRQHAFAGWRDQRGGLAGNEIASIAVLMRHTWDSGQS